MKYKNMSPEEVKYLDNIYNRTKKHRIRKKLMRRISDGTFNGFMDWIAKHREENGSCNFIIMPTSIELAKRVYKE